MLDLPVKVEIWSDVVCPWCYVGKRRFEAALRQFEHREEVEVAWRSFELDPRAPARRDGDYAGHLARKYGIPLAEGQAMLDRMTAVAAGEGLAFRFDRARPGNTFDAHRLTHLAAEAGRQDELVERLFRATFTEGEPVGDRDALLRLAVDAGLEPDEVRSALESDLHADAVRADEAEAAALGIRSVPFFVVGRAYAVPGAQSPEVLHGVLERGWRERRPAARVGGSADRGPGCDGPGCAV